MCKQQNRTSASVNRPDCVVMSPRCLTRHSDPPPRLPAVVCSWSMGAAGRFSLDSAADRLSEDMSRLSFEAAARCAEAARLGKRGSSCVEGAGLASHAPHGCPLLPAPLSSAHQLPPALPPPRRPLAAPTANPYASAFFMAGAPPASEAPQPSELRMSAPAGLGGMERRLPPLRTGSNKSASPGGCRLCCAALRCGRLQDGGMLCPELMGGCICAAPVSQPPRGPSCAATPGTCSRTAPSWLLTARRAHSRAAVPACSLPSADPPTEEAAGQLLGGTALHRLQ